MRRSGLLLSCSMMALLAAGCTINWGEGGITDVKLGGRDAGTIVQTTTNADSEQAKQEAEAKATQEAEDKARKEEDDGKTQLRKIAILPVAWTDGTTTVPCDLCPSDVQLKPTGKHAARLVTGFIYEAVAEHPRFLFPTPDVVDKALAGRGMKAGAEQLAATGKADWVIASALIELRPRVGDDQNPERPAGVALYCSLVEARTGKVLWSKTFDRDESGRGFIKRSYDTVMNDRPVRYSTAEGYSEKAADKLIHDLVKELD